MKKGNAVLVILIIAALVIVAGAVFYANSGKSGSDSQTQSQSKVLAGDSAPYIEFNKTDYDKAQKDGKVILLNFYANWCPICRVEEPDLKAGFDSLKKSNIVGFRVNFNDSETDEVEKALAKQFEILYQHTKVILKDGKVVLKSGEAWDKETLLKELGKVAN